MSAITSISSAYDSPNFMLIRGDRIFLSEGLGVKDLDVKGRAQIKVEFSA